MKYFKDENNAIFGLKETQLRLKKSNWIEITENEVLEMTKKEHNIETQKEQKIAELNAGLGIRLNAPIELNNIGYEISSNNFAYFDLLYNENDEVDFICADNEIRKLSKADYEKLKLLQAQRKNELALAFRLLKNEVEKAQNSNDLKEIKWQ